MSDLSEVEARHGFTFGGSDKGAQADAVAVVVCSKPGCTHAGSHVQLHADTPLPVYCGGCGTVLHCDHVYEDVTAFEGPLSAPVRVVSQTCTVCGHSKDHTRTVVDPVDLSGLPAAAFAQHLG